MSFRNFFSGVFGAPSIPVVTTGLHAVLTDLTKGKRIARVAWNTDPKLRQWVESIPSHKDWDVPGMVVQSVIVKDGTRLNLARGFDRADIDAEDWYVVE